jgi:hypothetical protein
MIDPMDTTTGDHNGRTRPGDDARRPRRLVRAGVGIGAAAAVLLGLGVAGATTGAFDPPRPVLADESVPGDEGTTTTVEAGDTTTTAPEDTTTTSEPEGPTTTLFEDTTTIPERPAEPDDGPTGERADGVRRGPDASGPAKQGLCRAFGHRESGPGNSVAASDLRAGAAAAGMSVAEFCGNPAVGRRGSAGPGERGRRGATGGAVEDERPEAGPPPSTPASPDASGRAGGRDAPGAEGRGPRKAAGGEAPVG